MTFRLFGKGGNVGDDLDGGGSDDGDAGGDAEQESNSVYVEDVVREKKMHFFKLPKLGCYFAVKLTYKNCLMPGFFSEALNDRIECDKRRKE